MLMVEDVYEYSDPSVEFLVFGKVVVCKLYNCKYVALSRIKKNVPFVTCYKGLEEFLVDDVYTGIAKCSADDEFDLEFGKKLALRKARIKRNKAVKQVINKYLKKMERMLQELRNDEDTRHSTPTTDDLIKKQVL